MRDSLKSSVGWSSLGWLLPLAYLALPNCSFSGGNAVDPNLIKGDPPWSSAIFCDIEKKSEPGGHRRCATDTDLTMGTPLSHAAVALTTGPKSNIGLDYRPGAPAESGLTCVEGRPVAIVYEGPFPEGYTGVCLNCTGATPGDVALACVEQCKDKNGGYVGGNSQELVDFCNAFAHTSTNASTCFDNACTSDTGVLLDPFTDPRRTPEPVEWTALVNVQPVTNNLTKTGGVDGMFDAGAASTQRISRGDGYVEFTVGAASAYVACGLSAVGGPPVPADTDPSLNDISFAVLLQRLPTSTVGEVFIVENGIGNPSGVFATYADGDRFRVTVTDNFTDPPTAKIAYFHLLEACAPMGCPGTMPLRTVDSAPYPFRVDVSLRDQGATLNDVRIVRIK